MITKLEDLHDQFMQVSIANHKNTEASNKNLETHMGQLAKQFSDHPSNTLTTTTENNPKDHCSVVFEDDEIVVKTK